MKKKIITAFAAFLSVAALAGNSPDESKLIAVIRNAVTFPSALSTQEEVKAKVFFTISENGVVSVQKIITSDETLKSHILKSLNGLHSTSLDGETGNYSTNIVFKLQ